MFSVHPEHLSSASREMGATSDQLGRTRADVNLVPPVEAFGTLPEAAALTEALARSVQASLDHLDGAVGASENIGSGLASCAQKYVDHDTKHARQIRGVGLDAMVGP
jgi:hypothetical protein